jgi:hypothetical protein
MIPDVVALIGTQVCRASPLCLVLISCATAWRLTSYLLCQDIVFGEVDR